MTEIQNFVCKVTIVSGNESFIRLILFLVFLLTQDFQSCEILTQHTKKQMGPNKLGLIVKMKCMFVVQNEVS